MTKSVWQLLIKAETPEKVYFLELQRAIDTVNHEILRHKLEYFRVTTISVLFLQLFAEKGIIFQLFDAKIDIVFQPR